MEAAATWKYKKIGEELLARKKSFLDRFGLSTYGSRMKGNLGVTAKPKVAGVSSSTDQGFAPLEASGKKLSTSLMDLLLNTSPILRSTAKSLIDISDRVNAISLRVVNAKYVQKKRLRSLYSYNLVKPYVSCYDGHYQLTDFILWWRIVMTVNEAAQNAIMAEKVNIRAAKVELEATANTVAEMAGIILPKVTETINELRSARMAIVSETSMILGAMREVRSFVMEKNHEVEVNRINEFVEACVRFKELKDSGVLDIMVDATAKMMDK